MKNLNQKQNFIVLSFYVDMRKGIFKISPKLEEQSVEDFNQSKKFLVWAYCLDKYLELYNGEGISREILMEIFDECMIVEKVLRMSGENVEKM